MKDMFVAKGLAVFTVNGSGLELALPRDPNAASLEPPTPIKMIFLSIQHLLMMDLYSNVLDQDLKVEVLKLRNPHVTSGFL